MNESDVNSSCISLQVTRIDGDLQLDLIAISNDLHVDAEMLDYDLQIEVVVTQNDIQVIVDKSDNDLMITANLVCAIGLFYYTLVSSDDYILKDKNGLTLKAEN